MNAKAISISTVVAVIALFAAIWQFDDRYAKAGDVGDIQTTIQALQTTQSMAIKQLTKHLDFEKQQAIYELEDKILELDKIENPTPDIVAKKNKYVRRLQALYNSN